MSGKTENSAELLKRFVKSIEWIREEFLCMDELSDSILMGISDWDDAACFDFGGSKLVVSTDGPYTKRLVMKSALVHAATDVLVKGAKPLFALDNLTGNIDDLRDMVGALKKQSLSMNIPLIGGNTRVEDVPAACTITVLGELLFDEPIRDRGAKESDIVMVVGKPIWGEMDERLENAKILFDTWFEILGRISKNKLTVNSAKDITKGGIFPAIHEIFTKSKLKFIPDKDFENFPYSRTRNLDNFLLTAPAEDCSVISGICEGNGCPVVVIGSAERL